MVFLVLQVRVDLPDLRGQTGLPDPPGLQVQQVLTAQCRVQQVLLGQLVTLGLQAPRVRPVI